MPRTARDGVAADHVLNLRLTAEDKALLTRAVAAEKADIAARSGLDPSLLDLTAASLIRSWIRADAKRRGWLPAQAVLPFAEPVAELAPVVPVVPVADVKAFVAAAPDLAAAVQEAAARETVVVPVVPVVPVEAPVAELAPVVPVAEHEHEAPVVRAALIAAIEKEAKQGKIAKDAGIDPTTLSKFKKGERELTAEKLGALAAVAAVAAELPAAVAELARPKTGRAKRK